MSTTRFISRTIILTAVLGPLVPACPASAAEDAPAGRDEVMRPTQYGLRLTPAIANALCRLPLRNENMFKEMPLTPEQESRMNDALARRFMEMGHRHGEHLQPFLETFIESMITHQDRFTPDSAREFSQRALPVLPGVREFIQNITQDARPILTPEQFAQFEEQANDGLKDINRFEGKMKRWADGGANEGERFDHYEPEDGPAPDSEGKERGNGQVQRARHMAEWDLRRDGPANWRAYLAGVSYFFKFDEAQVAEAHQLLADYHRQAETVMTDEWTRRIRQNRVRYHLRHSLGDLASGPWLYRLDREYRELLTPVAELGTEFRRAVLALATDAQREAALAEVRDRAARHGLDGQVLDLAEAEWRELSREQSATAPGG